MKIFDLETGRLVQELDYCKHDAQANVAVASDTPIVAALTFSWKWGVGSDLDFPLTHWTDWFALFRLVDPEPFYTRNNVRLYDGPGSPSVRTTVRISAGGEFIAYGEEKAVKVYHVEENDKVLRTKPSTY